VPDGDLYDIRLDGLHRDGFKALLNALLFAREPIKCCSALTGEEGRARCKTVADASRPHPRYQLLGNTLHPATSSLLLSPSLIAIHLPVNPHTAGIATPKAHLRRSNAGATFGYDACYFRRNVPWCRPARGASGAVLCHMACTMPLVSEGREGDAS
jgi:hypothetical protein